MIWSITFKYLVVKVKYKFLFTENLNVTLGYNWSNMKVKYDAEYDGEYKLTDTGFTFGVTYNF